MFISSNRSTTALHSDPRYSSLLALITDCLFYTNTNPLPMSEGHNKLNVTRWLSDLQSLHLTPTRPKRRHRSSSKEPNRSSKRYCVSQTADRVVFAQLPSNIIPANQKGVTLEKSPLRKSSRTPSPTKRHLDIVTSAPAPTTIKY